MLRKLYYSNGVYTELSDLFGFQSDDSLVEYENEAEKLLDVNVGIETQYITLTTITWLRFKIACRIYEYVRLSMLCCLFEILLDFNKKPCQLIEWHKIFW